MVRRTKEEAAATREQVMEQAVAAVREGAQDYLVKLITDAAATITARIAAEQPSA